MFLHNSLQMKLQSFRFVFCSKRKSFIWTNFCVQCLSLITAEHFSTRGEKKTAEFSHINQRSVRTGRRDLLSLREIIHWSMKWMWKKKTFIFHTRRLHSSVWLVYFSRTVTPRRSNQKKKRMPSWRKKSPQTFLFALFSFFRFLLNQGTGEIRFCYVVRCMYDWKIINFAPFERHLQFVSCLLKRKRGFLWSLYSRFSF